MGGTIEAGAQKIENAMKVAFVNLGTPLLDEVSGIQGRDRQDLHRARQ
jgi:hypothetical protein